MKSHLYLSPIDLIVNKKLNLQKLISQFDRKKTRSGANFFFFVAVTVARFFSNLIFNFKKINNLLLNIFNFFFFLNIFY